MTNGHNNDIILRLPASSNRLVMTQLRPCSGEREWGGKKEVKRWSQPSRAHSPRVSLMQTHHCNVWHARTDLLPQTPSSFTHLIPKFSTSCYVDTYSCCFCQCNKINTCEPSLTRGRSLFTLRSDSTDTMSFRGVQINMCNLSRLVD